MTNRDLEAKLRQTFSAVDTGDCPSCRQGVPCFHLRCHFFLQAVDSSIFWGTFPRKSALDGLWLVLCGKMNPQRTGIVVTGFFALEALKNIRNLILGAYSLDVFTVSACMMIPYVLGAVGAYWFFVRNDKRKCFAVIVNLAAAFGIIRQLYTILMMNLIANHLVTGLHVLISVLVVMVYVLFIYQTAVLIRKRKSADTLSSQTQE